MPLEKIRSYAQNHPKLPAIVWKGEVTSYEELDRLSDDAAASFKKEGYGKGDIILLDKERGADWIIQSIAICKIGAVYVPVSQYLPETHRKHILDDIKTKLDDSDAWVIFYTSGSTGVPKGSILSKEGVTELCKAHIETYGFVMGTRAAVQSDMGFDAFLLSTLPYLYCGGTLYIMDNNERISLVGIHRFLMKNKIETTFLTTQLARKYMESFDNKYLKALFLGGEAIYSYKKRSFNAYNLYGPSEFTAYVTRYRLSGNESGAIPIGTPIGKTRIYLENGEICLSGPQSALGYLNRPEEEEERFVLNPHYNKDVDPGFDPLRDGQALRFILTTDADFDAFWNAYREEVVKKTFAGIDDQEATGADEE